MPIQFNCGQCQSVLQTPDEMAGKQCKCPTCGHVMPIPHREPVSDALPEPKGGTTPYQSSPFRTPQPETSSNPFSSPVVRETIDRSYDGLPPHRGEMILAFGIISLLGGVFSCGCCPFVIPLGIGFGIPATLMGRKDLKAMDEYRMNPAGRSTTNAGMICGIIGMIIGGLGVAAFLFQIIVALAGAA